MSVLNELYLMPPRSCQIGNHNISTGNTGDLLDYFLFARRLGRHHRASESIPKERDGAVEIGYRKAGVIGLEDIKCRHVINLHP